MDISVEENILNIQKAILEHKSEILRLEGSLRVFNNMKQAGVEIINIKQENILKSKEVIEDVGNTS